MRMLQGKVHNHSGRDPGICPDLESRYQRVWNSAILRDDGRGGMPAERALAFQSICNKSMFCGGANLEKSKLFITTFNQSTGLKFVLVISVITNRVILKDVYKQTACCFDI